MDKKVRFNLALISFFVTAGALAAPGDLPGRVSPPVLALASVPGRAYTDLKQQLAANSSPKAVFIAFADPLSGFALSGINIGPLGSISGRDGNFLFDATNLLGIAGGSALYLGTVNPENPIISITFGANASTFSGRATTASVMPEVPSDPTGLLLLGLGFAAFGVARRARRI